MTDDIVDRLREAERQYVNNKYNLHARAADEIERLRAALILIDRHNDDPKRFNLAIHKVVSAILSPEKQEPTND